MKLLRYGAVGREKPAILDDRGQLRDLSGLYADIDDTALGSGIVAELHHMDLDKLPVVTGTPRLGPCISGVGKMLCIGLNCRVRPRFFYPPRIQIASGRRRKEQGQAKRPL